MDSRVSLAEKISIQERAFSPVRLAAEMRELGPILLSLLTISALIYFFHLEMDIRLIHLMPIIVIGFVLNHFLPLSWRLPALFLLNLAAIFALLGPLDGSILVVLGLMLFGLANLPVPIRYRIGLALGAGALLAVFRAGWLPLMHGKATLPILGGMFMFRLILYLYEMQFEKQPASIWKKLNYFFLLPNLIFAIFPVVDYQTFVRGHYARPAFETYRKGALMMANGVFHLLLYRLIYYYLLPAPGEVQDVYGLLQYMVASYALIVRLAGIFHFSAGVICLFGFNLPPTFDHYFFANSFSDLWRRINIYWRDFVIKVFYFPLYFRLKRYGATFGLALSVLIVFFINWFLHGYQWFWIRGVFPLTVQDAVFWGVFGVLVAANSVAQSKRRSSAPRPGTFSWAYSLRNAFNIIGIFTFMIVLWSFWTSDAVGTWLAMVGKARSASPADIAIIIAGTLGLAGLGALAQYSIHLNTLKKRGLDATGPRRLGLSTAGLAALVFLALPPVSRTLEHRLALDLEPVFYPKLNAYDREQLYKGYYETLLAGNTLSSRMWELEQNRPDDWKNFSELGVSRQRNDIMMKELLPNQRAELKGGAFTTNSHGFRDQEYSLLKPPGTVRFALLGGSIEMGTGIANEETYEQLTENALNGSQRLFGDQKVEILNFGVAGFHLYQDLVTLEEKAAPFQPDVVVFTTHPNEEHRILSSILQAYWTKRDLVYPFLEEAIAQADLSPDLSRAIAMERLQARQQEIIAWGYGRILEYCAAHQAIPLWLYVPTLDDNLVAGEAESLEAMAAAMGFYTLNLQRAFDGQPVEELKIAPWDFHPNARGHELLAQEWLRQLETNEPLRQALQQRAK
jgi:D-alanyl-lipoteichoic acid acyltransferase DltB (MBOAT superfamily)